MQSPTYMVVATIRDDTDMGSLAALVPEETAQVERLRTEGRMGAVHVALARRVVFIEVFGADEDAVRATVNTLPMAPFFELDLYPTTPVPRP